MVQQIMRLEDRIVLDGAAGAVVAEAGLDVASTDQDQSHTDQNTDQGADSQAGDTAAVRVLVVPEDLQDGDDLAEAARDKVITVRYDPGNDSPEQLLAKIANALNGARAESIALAIHGNEDGVSLFEGEAVTADSLSSDDSMQDFFEGLSDLMNDDGRLDLLSCDLAGSESGQQLISLIHDITGLDVAASDDATGNPDDGGDWLLESGNVNLIPLYFDQDDLQNFDGTLPGGNAPTAANETVWTSGGSYTFAEGDFNFSDLDGNSFTYVRIDSLPSVGYLQYNAVTVSAGDIIPVSDINLNLLAYYTSSDDSVSFTFSVADDVDGYSASNYTMTVNVPTVDMPANTSILETGTLDFSGGDIHINAESGLQKVTISVTSGTITLDTTGLTIFSGGSGTSSITVEGDLADINTALDTMVFSPPAVAVLEDVTLSVVEFYASTFNESMLISVYDDDGVNTAPTIVQTGMLETYEDNDYTFDGNLYIKDDSNTGDIQIQLGVSYGTLTVVSGGCTVAGCGTGSVTLTGTVSEVNQALSDMVYSPDANYTGTDSLVVHVDDLGNSGTGGSLTADQSYSLPVYAVNDAPEITAPTNLATDVDVDLIITSVSVADDSEANDIQVDLTVSHGTLTMASGSGASITGDGTGAVQLIGSLAEINAALYGMTFTPSAGYSGYDTLQVDVDDQGYYGVGSPETDTASVSLTIGDENEAPVITAPASAGITTGDPLHFTGISVSDDSGTDPIVATLSVSYGTLNMASGSGAAIIGDGTSSVTVTGSVAQINAALYDMTYISNAGYTGSDTLNVSVDDQGHTGFGGTQTDSDSVAITVSMPVNDPPVVTLPGTQTMDQDASLTFDGNISISDDSGAEEIVARVYVSHGTLTAVTGMGAAITGNGTAMVILTGSQGEINAALDGLVYTPSSGYSGSDTLTVYVNDQGHTGSGGTQTTTLSMDITVRDINDAPTISAPSSVSMNEDGAYNFNGGVGVSDDSGSNDIQTVLGVGHGSLWLATGTGAAIIGNGTGQVTLTGSQSEINAAMDALTYRPSADYNGSDALRITVNDQGNTGTGGAKTASSSVGISIAAVNDPAVITMPDTLTLTSDGGFALGDLISISDDSGDNPIMVVITVTHGELSAPGDTYSAMTHDPLRITLYGNLSNIRMDMARIMYSATGAGTYDALTVTITDMGYSGSGGTRVSSRSMTLNVPTATPIHTDPTSGSGDGTTGITGGPLADGTGSGIEGDGFDDGFDGTDGGSGDGTADGTGDGTGNDLLFGSDEDNQNGDDGTGDDTGDGSVLEEQLQPPEDNGEGGDNQGQGQSGQQDGSGEGQTGQQADSGDGQGDNGNGQGQGGPAGQGQEASGGRQTGSGREALLAELLRMNKDR